MGGKSFQYCSLTIKSDRTLVWRGCEGRPQRPPLLYLWSENDFNAALFLLVKYFVSFRSLVQIHPMRNHEAWIDFTIPNTIQQRFHVMLDVRLAGLNLQRSIHDRSKGDLIEKTGICPGD